MNSRIPIWKPAALASSLLLLAGFVAYSAGAFEVFAGSPPPAEENAIESNGDPTPALLPGSKSYVGTTSVPVLLPGSKALSNLGVGRSGNAKSPGAPGFEFGPAAPPHPPKPAESKSPWDVFGK